MTIHVSLVSKNIVNVFVGTKEEAQADGAELIEPTTDEVTYSDGTTDEVYGFDIPVENWTRISMLRSLVKRNLV